MLYSPRLLDQHGKLECLNYTSGQARRDAISRERREIQRVAEKLRTGLSQLTEYLGGLILDVSDPGRPLAP